METFVENKSKKLAFTFTVGIHLLLFLFLLFTGFIIPNNESAVKTNNNDGLSMAGYKLIEIEGTIPSETSVSSEKFISDPNQTDFKLEKSNAVVKPVNTLGSEDLEYESLLKKWSGRKKSNKQNENSTGNNFVGMSKDNDDGETNSIETGGTFILKNRSLLQKPEIILNASEEGRVVVDIVVNETGKVVSAIAGKRGSTTTSAALYEKAVKAALTAKFNPSSDAIKEQRGTYTFVFTLE